MTEKEWVATHIDDWAFGKTHPFGHGKILQVKHWFREFRMPAVLQDRTYLESKRLTCTYEGERYRCIGASRMGDVWLTANMDALLGYDKRVCIDECSEWDIEDWKAPEATQ